MILKKENKYEGTPTGDIINQLSTNIVPNTNIFDDTLNKNNQALQGDNDFVNDLIDKGLYIASCEL